MSEPLLSVIIASRDRAEHLGRALASLEGEWAGIAELLVVDNGSRDGTPQVIAEFRAREPKLRGLRHEPPGKAGALNAAFPLTTSPWLAYLDDDAFVQPGWSAAFLQALRTREHPGFQGRIRLPPEVRADARTAQLCQYYRTLPVVDQGDAPSERSVLAGANMAIRRAEIAAVGGFDARLGPGASGLSEDTDLSNRIRRRTGRTFGYVPDAEVVHVYDPERLTPGYFEAYFRRLGRSRIVMLGRRSLLREVPSLASAWLRMQWSGRFESEGARFRARAEYFVRSEMVRVLQARK